jgi:hypothetical protein
LTPVKVALLPSSYPTNPGHALSVPLLSLGGAALVPIVAPFFLLVSAFCESSAVPADFRMLYGANIVSTAFSNVSG